MATIESAQHAIAYSSGMAAIAGVLDLVRSGGRIVASSDLYGGRLSFACRTRLRTGVLKSTSSTPRNRTAIKEAFLRPIDLLLIESPSNPMHRVCDIAAAATLCQSNNCLLAVRQFYHVTLAPKAVRTRRRHCDRIGQRNSWVGTPTSQRALWLVVQKSWQRNFGSITTPEDQH